METPEQIEAKLRQKLMPRGFSESGALAMDELIDSLAGECVDDGADLEVSGRVWDWKRGAKAAAILLGAGVLAWWSLPESRLADEVALTPISSEIPEVALISESQGVLSATEDEHLHSDESGRLMRGWHLEVLNEERFEDLSTGLVVTVIQPREELVLFPVTSF